MFAKNYAMTPKEKARDLFDSYWHCLFESDISDRNYYSQQCALIAVDICLHTCVESMIYYWKEVEDELNLLPDYD
jgi:hypothetical protein